MLHTLSLADLPPALLDRLDDPFPETSVQAPMQLFVRRVSAGWIVGGLDRWTGPFVSREQVMDLAEGMADAIRSIGTAIEIVIQGDAPSATPHAGSTHATP